MYSDSDTESDSGASGTCDLPLPFPASTSTSSDLRLVSQETAFSDAVEVLKDLQPDALTENPELQAVILNASGIIYNSLDSVQIVDTQSLDIRTILAFAIQVFDSSFLIALLKHRRHFHQIGTQSISYGTSIIVCWADSLIVKLNDFAVALASGLIAVQEHPSMPKCLNDQYQDDSLRGAAQLPYEWFKIPEVLSSESTSAAAKRVASRLLLGVFILRPQACGGNPWLDGSIPPMLMLDCLSRTLARVDLHPPLLGWFSLQEKLSHSVLVVLYAAADMEVRQSLTNARSTTSPWKPRTLGVILEIIELNLPEQEDPHLGTDFALGVSQTVLLRWGRIVPWSWMVWDDQRVAGAECVVPLAISWLCHVGRPLFEGDQNPSSDHWKIHVASQVETCPSAAQSVMTHVLEAYLSRLPTSQPSFSEGRENPSQTPCPIYRCSWALLHLVKYNVQNESQALTADLCICFLRLFLALGTQIIDLETKDLLLEALSYAGDALWATCLKVIQNNKGMSFSAKLDDLIICTRRKVARKSDGMPLLLEDVIEVKTLLTFLGIIWHKGSHGCLHRQTVAPFLRTIVSKLSRDHFSEASSSLRDTLLTTLSIFETPNMDGPFLNIDSYWEDEAVWQISLVPGNSIIIASSLSHYILSSKRLCSGITCLEAWDLLRDALLLVLSRQYLQDDEAIALISAPALCQALSLLLTAEGTYALLRPQLPWTLNLSNELSALLATEPDDQGYYSMLKERITPSAQFLLDLLSSQGSACSADMVIIEHDIIFCKVQASTRFLLVPRL